MSDTRVAGPADGLAGARAISRAALKTREPASWRHSCRPLSSEHFACFCQSGDKHESSSATNGSLGSPSAPSARSAGHTGPGGRRRVGRRPPAAGHRHDCCVRPARMDLLVNLFRCVRASPEHVFAYERRSISKRPKRSGRTHPNARQHAHMLSPTAGWFSGWRRWRQRQWEAARPAPVAQLLGELGRCRQSTVDSRQSTADS